MIPQYQETVFTAESYIMQHRKPFKFAAHVLHQEGRSHHCVCACVFVCVCHTHKHKQTNKQTNTHTHTHLAAVQR